MSTGERLNRIVEADKNDEHYWWCPTCERIVLPTEVTFSEHHDTNSGGCGRAVIAKKGHEGDAPFAAKVALEARELLLESQDQLNAHCQERECAHCNECYTKDLLDRIKNHLED